MATFVENAFALRQYENHLARLVDEKLDELYAALVVKLRKHNPLKAPPGEKRGSAINRFIEEAEKEHERVFGELLDMLTEELTEMGVTLSEAAGKELVEMIKKAVAARSAW